MFERDAEQTECLKEFGLPTYAIRAYLALLKLGTCEARHVSELARIPPAKVYGTLDQLQQKGLVDVAPGKPRKYTPVQMADFLERRLQDHRDRMEELAARKQDLVELFPLLGTAEAGERACISTLRGRRNITEHFRETAAAARRDLTLLLPADAAARLRAAAKALAEARARGVRIRVLAQAGADRDDLLAVLRALPDEVRLDGGPDLDPDVALATFDGEAALLAHFVPGQASRSHPKDVAILTRETALARTLAGMLHQRWRQAAPARDPPRQSPPDVRTLVRGVG